MRLGYLIFPALLAFALLLSCQEEEVFIAEVTRITLEADKTTLTADNEDLITLSAEAFDQNDEPMPGASITYFANGQALSGNVFKTSSFGDYTLEARANGINSNTIDVLAERVELTFEIITGTYFPLQTAEVIIQENIVVSDIDTVFVGDEIASIKVGDSSNYELQVPVLPTGEYEVTFTYEDVIYTSNISIQEHDYSEEGQPEAFADNYIKEKNDFIGVGIEQITGLSDSNKAAIRAAWAEALEALSALSAEDKVVLANYLKTLTLMREGDAPTNNGRILNTAKIEEEVFPNVYTCQNATSLLESGVASYRQLSEELVHAPEAIQSIKDGIQLGAFTDLLSTAETLRGCLRETYILREITTPVKEIIESYNEENGTGEIVSSLAKYSISFEGEYRNIVRNDRSRINNEEVETTYQTIKDFDEVWDNIKEEQGLDLTERYDFFSSKTKVFSIPSELIGLSVSSQDNGMDDIFVKMGEQTEEALEFSLSSTTIIDDNTTVLSNFDLAVNYESTFLLSTQNYSSFTFDYPNFCERQIASMPALPVDWWSSLEEPLKVRFNELMGRSNMSKPKLVETVNLFCNWPQLQTELDLSSQVDDNFLSVQTLFFNNLGLTNGSFLTVLPYFQNLSELDISNNNISGEVVFPEIVGLRYLFADNNAITSINIEKLTNLSELWINDNELTSLKTSGLKNLFELQASRNNLQQINLSGLSNLGVLSASDNQISEIDLSSNPNLQGLAISRNKLSEIDLSPCPTISVLGLADNDLYELDITGLPELEVALLLYNNLSFTFDCSNNEKLEVLDLSNNGLQDIKLPDNPVFAPTRKYIVDNRLKTLFGGLNIAGNPLYSEFRTMLSIIDRMPMQFGWGCIGNQISRYDVITKPGFPPESNCGICEEAYYVKYASNSIEFRLTLGYKNLDALTNYYQNLRVNTQSIEDLIKNITKE